MSAKDLSPKEQRDIAVAFGVYIDKEDRIRGTSPDCQPFIIINRINVAPEPSPLCLEKSVTENI